MSKVIKFVFSAIMALVVFALMLSPFVPLVGSLGYFYPYHPVDKKAEEQKLYGTILFWGTVIVVSLPIVVAFLSMIGMSMGLDKKLAPSPFMPITFGSPKRVSPRRR